MRLIEWEVGENGYEEQTVIPKEQRGWPQPRVTFF